jgi:hypothetical protein
VAVVVKELLLGGVVPQKPEREVDAGDAQPVADGIDRSAFGPRGGLRTPVAVES